MFNEELFYFINHNLQNPFFDSVMPYLTHFGGFKFLVMIMIIAILYTHLKRKMTLRRVFALTLIALLFSGLITVVLKNIIYEPRPFAVLSNVHLLIIENDPCSFPSGHATSTFAVVTFLVLNMKDLVKKHYKIIDVVLIIFAIAVSFSRIYVGVHYPLDVLAGAVIGIVGGFLINHFKSQILSIIKI